MRRWVVLGALLVTLSATGGFAAGVASTRLVEPRYERTVIRITLKTLIDQLGPLLRAGWEIEQRWTIDGDAIHAIVLRRRLP